MKVMPMGKHNVPTARRRLLAALRLRRLIDVSAGAFVGVLIASGAAMAFAPTPAAVNTIACPAGQVIIVRAGGIWSCAADPKVTPSATTPPTATSTVTVTPSPSATPSPTTSPTVTPSPTGVMLNCFGDVKDPTGPVDQARLAACGYPSLASVGVPAGVTLTDYAGPLSVRTAGTVIDGKMINGCLDIEAANVTIRNSSIVCGSASDIAGIFADNAPATANLRIEHVEINCVTGKRHGIWGHSMIVTGTYIHDCENGLEVNANSTIIGNYLMAREGDPSAHGDDIQSQGGGNVVIRGNTFAGLNPITSSIISNPDLNNGWTIENNFFSAGAFTVYCPENGTGWIVRGNRFYAPVGNWGMDPHRPAFGFTDACNHAGIEWADNFRDNDGSVVASSA